MNALQDKPGEDGRGRLTLQFDGGQVFADYHRIGPTLIIAHVEADPALRNTGAARQFMQTLTEWAREQDERLEPHCAYAAHWFSRHPEAADVLA